MSLWNNILSVHAQRYPLMEARDYVKLLYQSEFGCGHLVEAGDALASLQSEFAQAREENYAPSYTVEAIGGGFCRCHLDPRLLAERDLPLLSRCLAFSARPRGTMAGLWRKLGQLSALSWQGALPLEYRELENFLSLYALQGCPPLHHSDHYREAYHPHYRVIDRDLAVYAPALRAIDAALHETQGPVLVAIDGRCAAGKTTFGEKASQLFDDCNVFHMDDFFLPPEKRTPERLAAPGGNVDYERASQELFEPLSRGEAVALRSFDCSQGIMTPPEGIPFRRLNLIEGSYALHPALAGYAQLHIFFTCGAETQLSRLEQRETPESLEQFRQRWIPMEEAYFQGLSIESQCDVIIDTSRLPTQR